MRAERALYLVAPRPLVEAEVPEVTDRLLERRGDDDVEAHTQHPHGHGHRLGRCGLLVHGARRVDRCRHRDPPRRPTREMTAAIRSTRSLQSTAARARRDEASGRGADITWSSTLTKHPWSATCTRS